MKPSRVFLVIMLAIFGFMLSNIEAAAIICGDDSTQTKTEPAAMATATATSGTTAILGATNEKSLPNQETSNATEAAPSTTTTSTTETSEVKKIFKSVQCSLEKARPWVEEIEKEAKRLEETAKRFGEDVISRLGIFVERLTSNDENTNPTLRLFNRFITGVGIGGVKVQKKVKPLPDVIIEEEQDEQEQPPVTEIVENSSSTTKSSTTPATILLADVDELENQINTDDK